jgi:hypothetical protein
MCGCRCIPKGRLPLCYKGNCPWGGAVKRRPDNLPPLILDRVPPRAGAPRRRGGKMPPGVLDAA